jgi:hypothetical protein
LLSSVTTHWMKLGERFSALVYYFDEPDGLHVVLTTRQGVRETAAVERFETVLAAGQSASVSLPRAAGEAPERVVLTNAGDHLHIAEPPPPFPPSDAARREGEAAMVDHAIEEIGRW